MGGDGSFWVSCFCPHLSFPVATYHFTHPRCAVPAGKGKSRNNRTRHMTEKLARKELDHFSLWVTFGSHLSDVSDIFCCFLPCSLCRTPFAAGYSKQHPELTEDPYTQESHHDHGRGFHD